MNSKRLVLAIGVVIFVIITSILIFSIDWGGSRTPVKDIIQPVNIADFADTNVQVRMNIRGPINNNQEHEDLQITVDRDNTIGELISGYQDGVSRSQETSNNIESYKAFLSALHNSNFTKSQLPLKGIQYDGACPKGYRYTFEFLGGGADVPKSSWATSCSKKIGTFAGELPQVKSLFQAQLPKVQFKALTAKSQF